MIKIPNLRGGFRSFGLFDGSLVAAFLLVSSLVASGLTIQRHGVTWNISGSPQNGTYANGDPWVVGPITITSITPTPTAGRNGTVINPRLGRDQGFDSRISGFNKYKEDLNVGNNLPLGVAANSSVVSSISASADINWGQVDTYAILTVVSSAPAANSFRPAYIGTGSRASAHTKGDMDYSKLAKLSSQGLGAPALSDLEDRFDKVWYEQDLTWTGRYMHTAFMGRNGYGKDMALQTGDAGLSLNLNYTDAQKEKLLISIIQYGIDINGILRAGGTWFADGGHNPGRLTPLIVAAMVLDDAEMKAQLNGPALKFQEYQQTFYVTQADVNRTRYTGDGRPRLPYKSSNIGMPEWGITHSADPTRDGNNWNAYYRDIAGSTLTASTMTAQVMDAKNLCNWGPLFGYARRHVDYEQSPGYGGEFNSNSTPGFHKKFYNAHKNVNGPGSGAPDTTEPDVSNVTSDPASTTVTISWSTDEASSSFVDFGTTTAYGTTAGDPTLVASHSVVLQGLQPSTTYHFRVRSEDASGNEAVSGDFTFTTAEEGSDPVSMPTIQPASSIYLGSVTILMSTATPGATIHYTLDGSTPTALSAVYNGALILTEDTTVKAIGVREGMVDSPVRQVDYVVSDSFISDDQWRNLAVPAQQTDFVFSFEALPLGNGIDAVIGLSDNPADAYTDLAAIVRFSEAGLIEARNGGSYQAVTSMTYEANLTYQVEMSLSLTNKTYSVTVAAPGGSPVVIAQDYSFRTEQISVSSLANLAMVTSFGSFQIANVNFGEGGGSGPVAAPVMTPAGGEFLEPVSVQLTTSTIGATIRYTTNGLMPDESSATYSTAITLSESNVLLAIASRDGRPDSELSWGQFFVGSALATSGWKNLPLTLREDDFVASFDFSCQEGMSSAIIGFTQGVVGSEEELATAVRLTAEGGIDALNDVTFHADDEIVFVPGDEFHVVVAFDTARKRYSVVLQKNGEAFRKVGLNWKFSATVAESLSAIGNVAIKSEGADLPITNFRINHPSDVLIFPRRPEAVREE
ncbi:MAG: chitobiase/beta-hexosaminidase C-terminal domain-containing protein [Verrucomicrobiota bacterium]